MQSLMRWNSRLSLANGQEVGLDMFKTFIVPGSGGIENVYRYEDQVLAPTVIPGSGRYVARLGRRAADRRSGD
jgi:hypothetical protein